MKYENLYSGLNDQLVLFFSLRFVCVVVLHLFKKMSFPLPLLKVETCGFLFWEGFQPIIRLAFQSSSMLLICMGMRYVSTFAMSFLSNALTRVSFSQVCATYYWGPNMCVFHEEFKVPLFWWKGFRRPYVTVKNPAPETSLKEGALSSPHE